MRVVVADDSMLTRTGIVRILQDRGVEVAGEASNAAELTEAVIAHRPDVAIVDIKMPPTFTDEGLIAAAVLRREHPGLGILVLSQYLEADYALRLIAKVPERTGYLLKDRVADVVVLIDALDRVARGDTVIDPTTVARLLGRKRTLDPLHSLSAREREVLALIAEGLSNSAIGTRLFIADRTVETHVTSIFHKLDISDDLQSHRRVLAVLAFLRADHQSEEAQ